MSLLPDSEFGLLNAWILVVVYLAASFVPMMLGGRVPSTLPRNDQPLAKGPRLLCSSGRLSLRVLVGVAHLSDPWDLW